jgi:hypothetical protein
MQSRGPLVDPDDAALEIGGQRFGHLRWIAEVPALRFELEENAEEEVVWERALRHGGVLWRCRAADIAAPSTGLYGATPRE